jgi:hypothetical protein
MPFDCTQPAELTGAAYWAAVRAAYHDSQGRPEHLAHRTDMERWGTPQVEFVRRAQVRRVVAARYGDIIPDTPEGRKAIVALVTATLRCHAAKRDKRVKDGWAPGSAERNRGDCAAADVADIAAWAPWMDAERMAGIVAWAGKYVNAGRGLGLMIRLTETERRMCKAWHLDSVDGPAPAERRKRDGTAGRKSRKHRGGAVSRAQYLEQFAGSERQTRPWESLGISESTYRRRKRLRALTAGGAVTAGSAGDVQENTSERPNPLSRAQGVHEAPAARVQASSAMAVAIRLVTTMDRWQRAGRHPCLADAAVRSPSLVGVFNLAEGAPSLMGRTARQGRQCTTPADLVAA